MAKLYFRNPRLCSYILGYLTDTEGDEPVLWDEIVDHFTTDQRTWRTVENRLYDLIAFGAIHRVGGNRPHQRRAVKMTPLGWAWGEQEILARPLFLGADLGRLDDDQDDGPDDDEAIS